MPVDTGRWEFNPDICEIEFGIRNPSWEFISREIKKL